MFGLGFWAVILPILAAPFAGAMLALLAHHLSGASVGPALTRVRGMALGALGLALWAVAVVPAVVVWWACLLGWGLLVLAAIDIACWRLPNVLTLPLGAAGLVFAALVPGQLGAHAIGWGLGLGIVVAINLLWRTFRGQDGFGWGDAKLLAAGGAWTGWAGLGGILFLAAVSALLAVGLWRWRGGRISPDLALPFGPALALGIWVTFLHGPLIPA